MPEQTKKGAKSANTEAPKKSWPELMTVDQVGEILDISRNAVKRLISSGQLPSLKIGGARRVARSDVWLFLRLARELGTKRPATSAPEAESEPRTRPSAEDRTLPLPHTERATA